MHTIQGPTEVRVPNIISPSWELREHRGRWRLTMEDSGSNGKETTSISFLPSPRVYTLVGALLPAPGASAQGLFSSPTQATTFQPTILCFQQSVPSAEIRPR